MRREERRVRRGFLLVMAIVAAGGAALTLAAGPNDLGFRDTPMLPGGKWHVHDPDRPAPQVVTPGSAVGAAPADAIVLFSGRSADAWRPLGKPWLVKDGVLTVPPRDNGKGGNDLATRQGFGDVQLHLEFRSPPPLGKTSQARGNSGIQFMQRYELQILDAYQNPTYADGTLGAVYGWKPPLANAARKPGEWQSYDVVFERPRFGPDGALRRPAYVTALLNGVLVQNHQAMLGTTMWRKVASYTAHGDAAPIQLQDHDTAVSFRNIWVRPLPPAAIAQDLNGESVDR